MTSGKKIKMNSANNAAKRPGVNHSWVFASRLIRKALPCRRNHLHRIWMAGGKNPSENYSAVKFSLVKAIVDLRKAVARNLNELAQCYAPDHSPMRDAGGLWRFAVPSSSNKSMRPSEYRTRPRSASARRLLRK